MFKSLLVRQPIQNSLIQFVTRHENKLSSAFTNIKPALLQLGYVNQNSSRNVHINRVFNVKFRVETENNHAYKVMQSIHLYNETLAATLSFDKPIVTKDEFDNLLAKHWRTESANAITETFKAVCNFAKENNIPVSDTRFDNLVDGLMDQCQDLTDDELSELLLCLNKYPDVEAITSHNFHDIWSALDDMCCRRNEKWSIKKTLLFADHWYLLGLSKYCDFTMQALKKIGKKNKQLTPTQLVQTLFYINVCRRQLPMFDYECRLEHCIKNLTIDELAIVSMSFFKTETTIKGTFLLNLMLGKLLEQTSTVNEITLCAILKIIRYSPHISLLDQIKQLLSQLIPEIDRLSILCCIHIALAGTNTQLFHPEILTKISQKFLDNIDLCRLKDLERLTFALTLFNFNPKTTTDIFDVVLRELRNPKRISEILKYPRCLPCCVHYLGLQQIYPYDLINNILDPQCLKTTYGNSNRNIGREILFLDCSIEINGNGYNGNRISPKLRSDMTKWSVNWIPYRNQKQRLTAADKLMLDVRETIEVVHGNHDYIHVDYILPHFQKPDLIVCKNKNGIPIEVKQHFGQYKLGDIMKPEVKDDLIWYAVVVGSWNLNIRDTIKPVGILTTKLRQLKEIGYVPVTVHWSEYVQLSGRQKENYIINILR